MEELTLEEVMAELNPAEQEVAIQMVHRGETPQEIKAFFDSLRATARTPQRALQDPLAGLFCGKTAWVDAKIIRKSAHKNRSKQWKWGNFRSEDQKRILQRLPVEGLQLPKMEAASDPIYRIPQNDQNVNAGEARLSVLSKTAPLRKYVWSSCFKKLRWS